MRTTSRDLALVSRRRHSYVRSASASSVAIIATLTICVATGVVGVIAAAVAASTLVALCFSATRSPLVRRYVDRESARHARACHESQRRRSLGRAAAARRAQYAVLLLIVGDIERLDPVEASRLELYDLLDHFVRLSVGHQRCLDSSAICGGLDSCDPSAMPESATEYRLEIVERRLRLRAECTKRLARITDEIACIDGFIRLVAQRAAVANLHVLGAANSEIDRRLTELDDVETAFGEIYP